MVAGTQRGEPSAFVVGNPVASRRWIEVRAGRGAWETDVVERLRRWQATIAPAAGPAADASTEVVVSRAT